MPQTPYTYSIVNDTANGLLAADALKVEIAESTITIALQNISAMNDDLTINMKDALSIAEKTVLDGVIANHLGESLIDVQKTQIYLGSNNITILEFGYNFVATKNTDTEGDLLLPVKYLRGSGFETENNEFGDSITVQLVDKDNVLGAGAGYIVHTYGQNVQIPKTGLFTVLSEAISGAIPNGLYFRTTYHSVGTVNDVKVRINCRGYNDAS